MLKTSKIATSAIGVIAALTMSAGASFADPAEHSDRGVRSDRGAHVEKMQGRGTESHGQFRDGNRHADVQVRSEGRHRDRDGREGGDRDRIFRGHRYAWGPGFDFYLSDGYYYGECSWLKRRAIETDNPVWWRRYHRCRDFS
jgi:hypothetical protein